MSYNDSTTSDEGTMSKFNAGIAQMQRIHELQQLINRCWLNPLAFNELLQSPNYEVIFRCARQLFDEAWPKLGEKEQTIAISRSDLIQMAIDKCHPFYQSRKITTNHQSLHINTPHWRVLERQLKSYERLARTALDRHGMNSPSDDDEGL